MTKQELLAKLNCPEELVNIAFVPVADVIKWIGELDESPKVTEVHINDLAEAIADYMDNEGTELINDYRLEMNYHEVSLESIDFNTREIKKNVKEMIMDHLVIEGN